MRPDAIDWTKRTTHADLGQRPARRMHRVVWRWLVVLAVVQSLCTIGAVVIIQAVGPVAEAVEAFRVGLQDRTRIVISADLFNGIAGCLSALLAVMLILLPLSRFRLMRWTTGLGRLHDATQSLSQGGIPMPTRLTGNQEVDHLLVGFNDMAARLRADRETLVQVNAKLETRVKERTEQWQEAARLAEQASEDKSRFLATMSHEIRTPLNGVIGSLQLVERTKIDRKQRQIIRTGDLAAKSLLNLINDVLDFSSINADRLQLANVPFALEQVVEEAIMIVGPLAVPKGIDLVFHIDPGVPTSFRGDPDRLRQVLINLINNAVKFTDHGSVQVTVTIDEKTPALMRFEVRDTGVGMSEEAMGRLFNEFEQAGNDEGHARGGTGLGLSICKHFTELMGGEIGVRSVVGQGSTFIFTARLQALTEQVQAESALAEELRVLLVDRRTAVRRMVCNVVEAVGCRFACVDSLSGVCGDDADIVILGHTDAVPAGRVALSQLRAAMHNQNRQAAVLLLYTEQELIAEFGVEDLPDGVNSLQVPLLATELRNALLHRGLMIDGPSNIAAIEPEADLTGLNILVAEDNPTNQFIVRNMLESVGAGVAFANHGQEALDALRVDRYDLVLMDYRMPIMNGIEAAQAIRRMEDAGELQGRTPIIALTANTVEGDDNIFTQAGMDDCLMKPIDLAELHRVIAERIGRDSAMCDGDSDLKDRTEQELSGADASYVSHLFDIDQLHKLAGNNTENYETLLTMLVSEFAKYKQEAMDIMSIQDAADPAAGLGHKIAGCAYQLSNPSLAQAARALENAEENSRLDAAQGLAMMIDDCLTQLSSLVNCPSDITVDTATIKYSETK